MRFSFAIVSALVLSSLVGCAAAQSEESDASNDALTATAGASCSAKAKSDAAEHFNLAISGAKARAAGKACGGGVQGDLARTYTISNEAYAAVAACADYAKIIETRSDAKPIRDALGDSLVLPALVGTLKEGPPVTGLAAAVVGKTVWRPAAFTSTAFYGSGLKLTFAANGKATYSEMNVKEDGNGHQTVTWVDEPATWSVDTAAGTLTATTRGKTSTYTLYVHRSATEFRVYLDSMLDARDVFDGAVNECEGS